MSEIDPGKEEGKQPEAPRPPEAADDARPLTGEPAATTADRSRRVDARRFAKAYLARYDAHLKRAGVRFEVAARAQKEAEKNGILGHGMHQPFATMFEDVFEEMPWHLKEQSAQMMSERMRKWPKPGEGPR